MGEYKQVVLIDFVTKSLANYSPDNIREAFSLYAQGKLELPTDHAVNLSGLWMSRLMDAWSKYAQAKAKSEVKLLHEPAQTIEQKEAIAKMLLTTKQHPAIVHMFPYWQEVLNHLTKIGQINDTKEDVMNFIDTQRMDISLAVGRGDLDKSYTELNVIKNEIYRRRLKAHYIDTN